MNLLRAGLTLTWLTFRRLLWSASTLMVLLPLAGCLLFVVRSHLHHQRYPAVPVGIVSEDSEGFEAFQKREDYRDFRKYRKSRGLPPFDLADAGQRNEYNHFVEFKHYSEFMILVYASFVVPICALAFGTASLGGDREDRTLVFLLVRPIPRTLILLAKFTATLPLVLGLVVGSFWIYSRLAGAVGREAFALYLPALVYMTLAYVCLFHLFAVAFRHSTIIALIYALFMELLLGNLPGIIKRAAVNYYGRSILYAAGAEEGLAFPDPSWFEPLSVETATWALAGIALGGLALAILVFDRREYRDLT